MTPPEIWHGNTVVNAKGNLKALSYHLLLQVFMCDQKITGYLLLHMY
jgi:hypothetical protein